MKTTPFRAAALAALTLVACGPKSNLVSSKYVVSQPVTASQGGTVQVAAKDNAALAGTAITIPAGALTADTTITITVSQTSVAETGQKAAGPTVEFGPDGTVFAKPVTISLPFALPAGATQAQLGVSGVESDGSTLTFAPGETTVSGSLVSVAVHGFTAFGAIIETIVDAGPATNSSATTTGSTGSTGGTVGTNSSGVSSGSTGTSGTFSTTTGSTGTSTSSGSTGTSTGSTGSTGSSSCSTDLDCAVGESCVNGLCTGVTTNDAGPATCSSNTDCGNNGVCCSGACEDLTSDANNCGACGAICAAGETCSAGACSAASCTVDTDCAAGQMCSGGTCQAQICRTNLDCASGFICDTTNDVCVVDPDGGPSDAGPSDAGPSDGGPSDAGVTDAGPTDGGSAIPACTVDTDCASGESCCGGVCADQGSDPSNCGACGMVCPSGQACSSGACGVACRTNSDCSSPQQCVADICQ